MNRYVCPYQNNRSSLSVCKVLTHWYQSLFCRWRLQIATLLHTTGGLEIVLIYSKYAPYLHFSPNDSLMIHCFKRLYMARVFWSSCGSAQHLVPGQTCSLFTEGGGEANKLGHTFWVSGWFGKRVTVLVEEEKGGKAATVQDAQAVVDRGCWVVVWR